VFEEAFKDFRLIDHRPPTHLSSRYNPSRHNNPELGGDGMAYEFELITVAVEGRAAFVTIDNPPVNVITMALLGELEALSRALKADPDLTVVVLRSADPDFFLAHFDVAAILDRPTGFEAQRDAQLKPFHVLCERFRTMNKVTIAQIEGRVGGGGSELAASCDMRFGVIGKTKINQMEVPLGILPGGTGTQRLPRLLGRGRAMEVILGADDLDAETAERWGYLNRIFAADAIGPFVDALARRIASFPVPAVRLAKESVNAAERPLHEGMLEEAYLFEQLMRTDEARRNMQRFLDIGGQTREGELRVNELNAELGENL
jgi:enoyl-CoA hydratase/carnithine racemase